MILRVTPAEERRRNKLTDTQTDILITWQYTTETGWLLLTRSWAWVVHSPVFEVDSRVQSSPSHRTAPRGHYNSACVWVWGVWGLWVWREWVGEGVQVWVWGSPSGEEQLPLRNAQRHVRHPLGFARLPKLSLWSAWGGEVCTHLLMRFMCTCTLVTALI